MNSFSNSKEVKSPLLIILTGSLGDVTRGLCLAKPIKTHWPKRPLIWLVEDKWAGIPGLNSYIDELVLFKRSASPLQLNALRKKLRTFNFGVSLDLQRIFKSGFFSMLAGAELKLGFNGGNAKEFNWLFNNSHIPYYPDTLPKLEHYLKFLDYLEVPYPAKPDFGLDRRRMGQMLPEILYTFNTGYAVLAAGSSWPSKDWHVEGYRQLARYLHENYGLRSVITGDKSQKTIAQKIAAQNKAYITDLTGQTNLPQLAAVLNRAQVAIGPDSGAGHISSAAETPYIALFGPTAPQRTAPYGYENLVVQLELECGPCYKHTCADNRCMRQIGLAEIEPKLKQVLGG